MRRHQTTERRLPDTIAFLAVACVLVASLSIPCDGSELFRKQVAPVLQRRCLSCHNDEQHKGDLSLQTVRALVADGHVEPGDSDASHLIDVITPTVGKAQMPKDADPLSPDEISAIAAWIDAGAEWPADLVLDVPQVDNFDWWSYKPIKRPPVPEIESSWARTPIDAFTLRKLQGRGLSHAEEADRRTLIRRVTYDLTGLPPTPNEVESFVNDDSPTAYEQLVDRLLASERYGERWARHWLDVVKYADTCGYDKDKLRPNAWPYRDYVIRSFNDDKPYSRFVQEQIAGDVLFPGEPDGILGLGFIAAGPWDFIGHVEVPESKIDGKVARNLDRDDMVCNTLNTFCSVTVQCARCHNHKFDPITQEHYYGLQSIFAAVDRAERPYDLDPEITDRRRKLGSEKNRLQAELAEDDKKIGEEGGPQLLDLNARIYTLQPRVDKTIRKEPEFGFHSTIAETADTTKWVEVDLGKDRWVSQVILHPCHDDFAGIGSGFGFPVRYKVEAAGDDGEWVTLSDHTDKDVPNPKLMPVTIDGIDSTARRIRITATKLAPRKDDFIFALAELEVLDTDGSNMAKEAAVTSLDSIEAAPRWSRENLTDGRRAEYGDPELAAELKHLIEQRAPILMKVFTPERVAHRKTIQDKIKDIDEAMAEVPQGKMVYAAATHFTSQTNFKPTEGRLRPVHVLHRGNIQRPRDPAMPRVLPLADDDVGTFESEMNEGERRAALAHWLTSKDHPLVWRSIVNRIWQYHFGQGIVATPNDFGRMGAVPTHPELLDWLAVEFRDGGQSMKALHRLIVLSSVYRQSSDHDEANAKIDAGNQFLWRMNRRRLEAEEIRDSILAVSGALDLSMGGPGYYLFELEKPEHSPHYEYHKFDPSDPSTHRRSIYRFIVRSQPNPWMTTLDCADSSQSTPRRSETLTSLQALSLLNSRFNLVMAERFAERLQMEEKTPASQVERAMWLITQRPSTPEERKRLEAYVQSHGLANHCRLLFNLSEFVYLD